MTLQASPGQLIFGCDMLLPIQFKADWAQIRQQKQQRIISSNTQENAKRIPHEYKIGDKVLLERPGIYPKLKSPRTEPFEVTKVYSNGTICIQQGAVSECVNI